MSNIPVFFEKTSRARAEKRANAFLVLWLYEWSCESDGSGAGANVVRGDADRAKVGLSGVLPSKMVRVVIRGT